MPWAPPELPELPPVVPEPPLAALPSTIPVERPPEPEAAFVPAAPSGVEVPGPTPPIFGEQAMAIGANAAAISSEVQRPAEQMDETTRDDVPGRVLRCFKWTPARCSEPAAMAHTGAQCPLSASDYDVSTLIGMSTDRSNVRNAIRCLVNNQT
jgi:hypothetical protein